MKSKQHCVICKKRYEAFYRELTPGFFPVYDDCHFRVKHREGDTTTIIAHDICPECAKKIVEFVKAINAEVKE